MTRTKAGALMLNASMAALILSAAWLASHAEPASLATDAANGTNGDTTADGTARPELTPEGEFFAARTLYGEARDQSPAELEAIAHVIYNRWRSGDYGTTVIDVVMFSRGGTFAFSCWFPGTKLFNDMNAVGSGRLQPYRDIIRSVVTARDAGGADPTGGATHYYHPKAMKPAGTIPVWARPKILRDRTKVAVVVARLAAGEDPARVMPPPWTHRVEIGDAVFMTIR